MLLCILSFLPLFYSKSSRETQRNWKETVFFNCMPTQNILTSFLCYCFLWESGENYLTKHKQITNNEYHNRTNWVTDLLLRGLLIKWLSCAQIWSIMCLCISIAFSSLFGHWVVRKRQGKAGDTSLQQYGHYYVFLYLCKACQKSNKPAKGFSKRCNDLFQWSTCIAHRWSPVISNNSEDYLRAP